MGSVRVFLKEIDSLIQYSALNQKFGLAKIKMPVFFSFILFIYQKS